MINLPYGWEYIEVPAPTVLILYSNNKTYRVPVPSMTKQDLPSLGPLCVGYVVKPDSAWWPHDLYLRRSIKLMSYT